MSRPALKLFRSLWGCEAHQGFASLRGAGAQLALLKESGYDGIEASLNDLGSCKAERRDMISALRGADLKLIVGAYSSWTDYDEVNWRDLHSGVDAQLSRFEAQLGEIDDLGAADVLQRVNTHSGSDSWSEEQAREYFGRAIPMSEGLLVSHETHRGRPLANPFVCHRLCTEYPELRLTLDVSHWHLVCERLVGCMYADAFSGKTGEPGEDASDVEEAVLRLVASRVDHIHARIGTPESPQLTAMPTVANVENNWAATGTPPADTEWEVQAAAAHEQLWQAVWRNQAKAGSAVVSATPEYGPAPYTPMAAGTGEPLSDVWEVTNDAAARLRRLFDATEM
jgi:hypothetical protein